MPCLDIVNEYIVIMVSTITLQVLKCPLATCFLPKHKFMLGKVELRRFPDDITLKMALRDSCSPCVCLRA